MDKCERKLVRRSDLVPGRREMEELWHGLDGDAFLVGQKSVVK